MKFFDIHVHSFPEKIVGKAIQFLENHYRFQWECSGTENDFLSCCTQAHVSRCVIFASATKPEQVPKINHFISSRVAADPGTLIGFGTLHPDYPLWKAELDRFASLNLRGVKLHPDFQHFDLDAPQAMKMYEELEKRDFPLLVHLGDRNLNFSRPYRLANVAKHFPQLRIVAAHMGGYLNWEEGREYLTGYSNIWFDTSSTRPFLPEDRFLQLIHHYGADRIMMGSDYPSKSPLHAAEEILKLDIPDADKEKICYLNACRFLRLAE